MREIKFKAWDKRTRKMVETGFHVLGEVTAFDLLYQYGMEHGKRKNEPGILRMNSFILMQYTGLHDKNGKEIYEGDILLHFDKRYVVKWDERMAAFQTENPRDTIDCDFFNWFIPSALLSTQESPSGTGHADCEVIGNIYENPELLVDKWK